MGANKKIERVGETIFNNFGSKMTIVAYNGESNVVIEFENGYKTTATYSRFKKGTVKSLYEKRCCNIGYLGEGEYETYDFINERPTKSYNTWCDLIKRVYSDVATTKRPRYKDCSVCEEWHNFQNFAKWFYENYYEIDGDVMHLDKDILVKGNKIYSPDTCVFVPKNINLLFTKSNATRGDFPIGVCYYKEQNIFHSSCRNNELKKTIHLGSFHDPNDAFFAYKNYKEKMIKQVADTYKDRIPQKLYNAMYRYKVEITD